MPALQTGLLWLFVVAVVGAAIWGGIVVFTPAIVAAAAAASDTVAAGGGTGATLRKWITFSRHTTGETTASATNWPTGGVRHSSNDALFVFGDTDGTTLKDIHYDGTTFASGATVTASRALANAKILKKSDSATTSTVVYYNTTTHLGYIKDYTWSSNTFGSETSSFDFVDASHVGTIRAAIDPAGNTTVIYYNGTNIRMSYRAAGSGSFTSSTLEATPAVGYATICYTGVGNVMAVVTVTNGQLLCVTLVDEGDATRSEDTLDVSGATFTRFECAARPTKLVVAFGEEATSSYMFNITNDLWNITQRVASTFESQSWSIRSDVFGHFILAFGEINTDDSLLRVRVAVSSGNAWSTAKSLSINYDTATGDLYSVELEVDSKENALVVWGVADTPNTDDGYIVQGRAMNATGGVVTTVGSVQSISNTASDFFVADNNNEFSSYVALDHSNDTAYVSMINDAQLIVISHSVVTEL